MVTDLSRIRSQKLASVYLCLVGKMAAALCYRKGGIRKSMMAVHGKHSNEVSRSFEIGVCRNVRNNWGIF